MKQVLVNGVFADHISVQDRGLQYGDGLFETILCHQQKLYYWPQHYQRLQQSAEKLAMDCPPEDVLLDDISRLLDDRETCAIRIILTRGNSQRGYAWQQGQPGRRIVQCSLLSADYSSLLTQQLASGRLFICRTQASINESLAGLKHLNRLENVMARNEFSDNYMDGLMLDANGHMIEGSMSNVFAIKNGAVYTPDLSRSGVRGIMRERITAIIKALNYPLHIRALTREEVLDMDALFISNSLIGMREVSSIMDEAFTSSDISRQVFEALLTDSRNALQHV